MKNVGNALDSREPGVTNWPVTTLRLVSHLCVMISIWGYTPVRITGVLAFFFLSISPSVFYYMDRCVRNKLDDKKAWNSVHNTGRNLVTT